MWFPLFPSEIHPFGRFGRVKEFRRLRTSIQGVALKTHNLFEKRLIKNFHMGFVRTVRAEFSIGVCAIDVICFCREAAFFSSKIPRGNAIILDKQ